MQPVSHIYAMQGRKRERTKKKKAGIYTHILRAVRVILWTELIVFRLEGCDLALMQIDRCLLYSSHAAIGPLISFRALQDTGSYGYGSAM